MPRWQQRSFITVPGKYAMKKYRFLDWEELPAFMQTGEVRPYWETLNRRRHCIRAKRMFDYTAACMLLVVLAVPMLCIAAVVRLDSEGPVFYRQLRVTAYGRTFRIHKFRTMTDGAEHNGPALTVSRDSRVTGAGAVLRKYRLDELPQIFDVLHGDMSFVGARPELVKYVEQYTPQMRATLLLPAGITSEASVRFRDESGLLGAADNADEIYVKKIMPAKMRWNLESIRRFSFWREIRTIIRTVAAVSVRD